MEPFAALSLASNVVQFVQFTSGLIRTAVEIHESSSGCTDDMMTLDAVYGHLGDLSHGLCSRSENDTIGLGTDGFAKSVLAIKSLALSCKTDCDSLLSMVGKLKMQEGLGGLRHSFYVALKGVWRQKDIIVLKKRLNEAQITMTLHICVIASNVHDARACQLGQLQNESQKMQLDQGAKLDQIMSSLKRLETSVQKVRSKNSIATEDIATFEEQLAQLSLSQERVAEEQAILKSLSFQSRPNRHESIKDAHMKTFRWVFEKTNDDTYTTSLANWLQSGNGIFWVAGKPGSGKSTLMKLIANEPTTKAIVSKWSRPERTIIASHYFWSAGTSMQKSQQGLLQTLLYDILRQCPDLIRPACGDRMSSLNREVGKTPVSWSVFDLQAALRNVSSQGTGPIRFCIFIDGLDEYKGDHFQLCQILKDLAKSPQIKLCLSSRPWNVFEEAFGADPATKIYMEDLTRDDIREFARSRLHKHPRWSFIEPSQRTWTIEEIQTRARGVFLWVFFVTKLLQEGFTNRDSFTDIRRRLESFPVELEPFFKQILESVEPFYHSQMATTLQMAVASEEPLDAIAYVFHEMEYEDENYVMKIPVEPITEDEANQLRDQTVWRLNSRTRGLLEMNRGTGAVSFMHRTVKDFLNTREMSDFLSKKANPRFRTNLTLLRIYTAFIKRVRFDMLVERVKFGVYNGNPNLVRLTELCFKYAAKMELADPSDRHNYELLEEIDRSLIEVDCKYRAAQTIDKLDISLFFREKLIVLQQVGFLHWKLKANPTYLFDLEPSLILDILFRRVGSHLNDDNQWRSRGAEMLRLAFETQVPDPNKPMDWNMNPVHVQKAWTTVIQWLTSWSYASSRLDKENFRAVLESNALSLLLEKGADPLAIVRSSQMHKVTSVLAEYLLLSFEVAPDLELEAMYLRVLEDFLHSKGDSSRSGARTSADISGDLDMRPVSVIASIQDGFFDILDSTPALKSKNYNFRLLAKVTEMLLPKIQEVRPKLEIESIAATIERAFPADFLGRIKFLHPEVLWNNVREKRRAGEQESTRSKRRFIAADGDI